MLTSGIQNSRRDNRQARKCPVRIRSTYESMKCRVLLCSFLDARTKYIIGVISSSNLYSRHHYLLNTQSLLQPPQVSKWIGKGWLPEAYLLLAWEDNRRTDELPKDASCPREFIACLMRSPKVPSDSDWRRFHSEHRWDRVSTSSLTPAKLIMNS